MSEQDDSNLVEFVAKRYDKAVEHSRSYYAEAERARLFARGDQWLTKDGEILPQPDKNKWRVRLTINRLKPAAERIINLIISSKPMIVTSPQTNDDDDRRSAKITQKLIRYYWEKLMMDGKLEEAAQWLVELGNVFLRTRWNPNDGPLGTIQQVDEMGMVQEVEQPLGDLAIDCISPLSIAPEPGAVELDDAAYFIVTETLTKDDVLKLYGIDVSDDDSRNPKMSYSRIFSPRGVDSASDQKERVIVYEYYERPTSKYPNGRLICTTNSKLLYSGDLPGGEYHVAHCRCIRLNGEFWGMGYVATAIPAQTQYNKMVSQMIEDHRLMGRPKWVAPVGSTATDAISSQPGQVIQYDPIAARGREPHPVMGTSVSPAVFQQINLAVEEINHLMSTSEVSQGQAVGSVNSAEQVIALQQADRGRFGRLLANIRNTIVKVGRDMASVLKNNLEDERIITIAGKHYEPEVVRFKKEDISDVANIHVDIESQLPWNRESARQQLMWMLSQGLISQEEFKERVGMPVNPDVYETEQTHRSNARRENILLEQMAFPPVETDNHAIHIEEHSRRVNQPEFREEIIVGRLTGKTPVWLINTLQHLEGHRMAIPPPAPPPAQTKLALTAQLPPEEALRISQRTVANDNVKSPQEPIDGSAGGMATPPGGMSGEMYVQSEPQVPEGEA